MHDRLVRGTLAGLIGGLFIILVNTSSYYLLRFGKAIWVHMLSQLVFGHRAGIAIEYIMGFVLIAVMAGGLGYIYAWFFVPKPDAGNYIFRGVALGIGFWLVAFSLGTLFRVPEMYNIAWETALTNLVAVIGWGLITGYLVKRWDLVYA